MSFAEGYRAMDWSQVIFSDEKIFWGNGFCGQTWVRRPIGDALHPQYCVTKRAHPVKVNVWACFGAQGQGYMHVFEENLTADMMKGILKEHLFDAAETLAQPDQEWYFLHDNGPQFKARLVQDWLESKSVRCIEFPPYSPDLNPIENLWAVLAREVEKTPCSTVEELGDCVLRVWKDASKPLMKKLVASMPQRIEAVIEVAGAHTKY